MEYLLKSDVMYILDCGHFIPASSKEWLKYNLHKLPTFPDPSLAVDGDLISRKGLKDEILSQYPEITVEWDAAFNALLRIINSMPSISPAPSRGDEKPATVKIPSDGVVTKVSRSDGKTEYPNQKCSEYFKESGNSKLLEMIAKAEWLNVKVVNPKELAMNVCFIRDSIAEVCNGMREIARLLAERGDK